MCVCLCALKLEVHQKCSRKCGMACLPVQFFFFVIFFPSRVWVPGRSRPYGTVRQTIRSSSSSETTESEQVYLRGGSQRAFPQSLIRDSGSEKEEVRGRGDEGRWQWRRPRTGCIGVWQRANRERGKWISGDNQMMSIRCYFLLHWRAFGFCRPRGMRG